MKKRNYMFIIVVQLLVLHSVSYSYSFNLLPAVDKIAEITSSNAIDNQVENGNFESGALSGWTLNSRIITDKYITGQSYEVNNDLPHTGYYSLYLYTHAVNQISGYRGGDLSVARNITYSELLRDYNLTGYVYVNRCSSVHYENWAGVTISFFDSSLAELGRIYYQFAEYGVTGDLYTHEIDLFDQRGSWLEFNRNITNDFNVELGMDPDAINQIELAFYVRVADGTNVGEEGYCDVYYDNWYFDAKNYPLYIVRNEDFEALGLDGVGTEEEPYLLEGYTISTAQTDLISIENTNAHFQIKDCYLNCQDGNYYGIRLYNASNGKIIANEIQNCWYGISIDTYSLYNEIISNNISDCIAYGLISSGGSNRSTIICNNIYNNGDGAQFSSSSYNNISKNSFYNNTRSAIRMFICKFNHLEENSIINHTYEGIFLQKESNNNTIIENYIFDCETGITIEMYSLKNNISCNTIRRTTENGIEIVGASDQNYIGYNNISDCDYYGGIWLESAFTNIIIGNTIYNCSDYGIQLTASNYNKITHNTIIRCDYSAIKIADSSSSNNVSWNDFIGWQGLYVEAYDSSNIFDFNYYDGFYRIDINPAGFYDEPHDLYPDCKDNHPLTAPSNIIDAQIEYLTYPTITSPLDGCEQLSGIYTIEWLNSLGSLGKTKTYSLYYSDDGGTTWIELATGLTTTQYNWDTTSVEEGSEYALKVVVSCPGVESVESFRGLALIIWNEESFTEPIETTSATDPRISPGWTVLIWFMAILSLYIQNKRKK